MAQTLNVLLWKTLILRKRRWIITLLEIAIPILLFYLLVYLQNLSSVDSEDKIVYDDQARKYTDTPSSLVYIKGYKIAYTAPSAVFASCDVIMKAVQATLGKNTKVTMVSQPDENSVVNWLRQQYIDENGNSDSIFGNSDLSAGVGVIFADSSSTSLKYTLRTTKETLFQTSEDTLYGEQSRGIGLSLYQSSGFLSVQAAIDQAYLASQQGISVSNPSLLLP
ncbi:hypothetical protein J6590_077317 [Homalodisca vitripennis]|nr:hypothetical protein J6590_077317 [Homalodisca vitripennis]